MSIYTKAAALSKAQKKQILMEFHFGTAAGMLEMVKDLVEAQIISYANAEFSRKYGDPKGSGGNIQ